MVCVYVTFSLRLRRAYSAVKPRLLLVHAIKAAARYAINNYIKPQDCSTDIRVLTLELVPNSNTDHRALRTCDHGKILTVGCIGVQVCSCGKKIGITQARYLLIFES